MATMDTNQHEDAFKPYDQFMLFGDSITQMGCNQEIGFGFHAALQECKSLSQLASLTKSKTHKKMKMNSLQSEIRCHQSWPSVRSSNRLVLD